MTDTGDLFLEVRYFESTGEIVLTNSQATGSPTFLSITGSLLNKKITGEVTHAHGRLGFLNAHFVSANVDSPPEGELSEERERLIKMYRQIVGVYQGEIKNESIGSEPLKSEIFLEFFEKQIGTKPNGEPIYLPRVKGTYRRLDDVHDLPLTVSYDAQSEEVVMVHETLSLRGTIRNDQLQAEIMQDGGYLGVLTAKKISDRRPSPKDGEVGEERRRLIEIYKQIEGLFKGWLVTPGLGTEKFPVVLSVYLFEEDRGGNNGGSPVTFPILKALYRRPDLGDIPSTQHLLKIQYAPVSGEMVMTDIGPSPPVTVPGGTEITIRGTISEDKTQIEGELFDRRGKVGHLSLKKEP